MARGLISLLTGFLPGDVVVILLCVVCVGFFGVFIPMAERKKKREEQEWYRSRERAERERNAGEDPPEERGF